MGTITAIRSHMATPVAIMIRTDMRTDITTATITPYRPSSAAHSPWAPHSTSAISPANS